MKELTQKIDPLQEGTTMQLLSKINKLIGLFDVIKDTAERFLTLVKKNDDQKIK
jgi:hypothetical protein